MKNKWKSYFRSTNYYSRFTTLRRILPQKMNIKDKVALVLLLVCSAIIRLYHIDFQSVWVDEINTLIQSTPNQSLLDTYRSVRNNDIQPPLYFIIVKYLFRFFGYNQFVLRLFSALLGVASIWAIYLLGRELVNSKTGLYAGLLLSVNYFHIVFSQEGRSYTFLILFTILSFYLFCLFLKNPTKKNAILFGGMNALMLYGHQIGMFAIMAQYLVLAWHFFNQEKQQRTKLIRPTILFSFVTAILYLPALPILYRASKVRSFWIELPKPNVFSDILSQFFGNSEMQLILVYLLLTWFFIKQFDQVRTTGKNLLTGENTLTRSFVILIPWIVCCTLIPLIRSWLVVPMIIPRYMNVVLPAVILMMALSISMINNAAIRRIVCGLMVIFSFSDMIVVKNYYNQPTKTDFRGVANTVIKMSPPDEKVISRVGWHYSYFFDNTNAPRPVIWKSLQSYADSLMKDKLLAGEDFWYVDAQDVPIELNTEATAFLNQNYLLDHRVDLFQAVGLHFVKKPDQLRAVNFSVFPALNNSLYTGAELQAGLLVPSEELTLGKGTHDLIISAKSFPLKKLNHQNAHITLRFNGKVIGGFFADESAITANRNIKLFLKEATTGKLELVFDNEFANKDGQRRVVVQSVLIGQ